MGRILKVLSVVIVFLVALPAGAIPTLDQYQDDQNGGSAFYEGMRLGQTFMAGLTGTLNHIEVGIGRPPGPTYPTTMEVRTTTGGLPGSTVLGSVDVPSGGLSWGWNSFDFAAQNIPMTAGIMYALVLSCNDPATEFYSNWVLINWQWDTAGYPAGQFCYNDGSGWEVVDLGPPVGEGDWQFQTYVDPIPAPGTIVLCGLGMGMVGWLRRYRALYDESLV